MKSFDEMYSAITDGKYVEYNEADVFQSDLRKVVETDLNKVLTDAQWKVMHSKAEEDGHVNGEEDVVMHMQELTDIVRAFI